MKPNQEYLDNIARKLEAFNQLNGFEPQQSQHLAGGFDLMDGMGQAALIYLERKKGEMNEQSPEADSLFRDHN